MGHHHEHSHHHNHNHSKEINNIKILLIAFSLTFIFMVIEFIGGFFSKSLALISDAGHMLSDVASMGIAIWAINQGTKNSTLSKTFGYKRTEVIAAFVNGITLVTISLLILKEGIERLFNPIQINQEQLIIIAFIGLLVNILVAGILFKNSKENINIRGAFLHVISDILGSLGAIGAGLIISFTGWLYADPLISIIIAILILYSSFDIIKDTYHTLMEGAPKNINFDELISKVKSVENVNDIHDLHIWSLNEDEIILTAHLVVNENINNNLLLSKVKKLLHDSFHVEHSTLELETTKCDISCN